MEEIDYGAAPIFAVVLSALALFVILICAVVWVLA